MTDMTSFFPFSRATPPDTWAKAMALYVNDPIRFEWDRYTEDTDELFSFSVNCNDYFAPATDAHDVSTTEVDELFQWVLEGKKPQEWVRMKREGEAE